MWPHDPQTPFKFANQRGKRIVLWLDDLHKFANPAKAAALCDLPRLFANVDTQVIIVTCRDGEEEIQARKILEASLNALLSYVYQTSVNRKLANFLIRRGSKRNTTAEKYRGTNYAV